MLPSMSRLSPILLAAGLAACGDNVHAPASCLPDCAADRGYDAIAYHLRASFAWGTSFAMTATEDVTVTAPSPVIELDSAVEVTRVFAGDVELPFVADAAAGKLRVDLSPLAAGGAAVTFSVTYTAQPSDALMVGGPRDDDPAHSTMLFTDSEPDRGLAWLVAKHDPSDRALWSVDLELPTTLDGVANGARLGDEPAAGGHTIRYALPQPIPTYLMAFAAGDLVHAERTTGRVPLALWYRRGLALDPAQNLDAIADAMATFEDRLGPYPFASYAVVLAPGYGGGMENATMTVNAESSGVGNVSFVLNAHELAHHWFGDWVTMRTYDDVWFKEGMATVLEAEAQRARRDQASVVPRLFGGDNTFRAGEAIVDPALHGLDKYNTGPYERAAWAITQIRAIVGEDVFWAKLRGFLAAHALGSATGEDFIRAFAPALDEPQLQRWLAALPAHASPELTATATTTVAGTQLVLGLTDPEAALLAPIGITVVSGAGTTTTAQLAAGTPVTVVVPPDGYLAPDERDVHPPWRSSFVISSSSSASVIAVTRPTAPGAIATWEARSAARQERVLEEAGLPTTDVTQLAAAVDSTRAKRSLVFAGCGAANGLPTAEASAVRTALAPQVATPAVPTYSTGYATCGASIGAPLAAELAALTDAVTPQTLGRLDYLLGLDYGTQTLALISRVATTAPVLLLRDRAINRLVSSTLGVYSAIPGDQRAAWQAFFRDRLATVTSQTRLFALWQAIVALRDVSALPLVAPLLHQVPTAPSVQLRIVCNAYQLATGVPGAWEAFQQATQPWATLSAGAAAALANPATCQSARLEELQPELGRGKPAREWARAGD